LNGKTSKIKTKKTETRR